MNDVAISFPENWYSWRRIESAGSRFAPVSGEIFGVESQTMENARSLVTSSVENNLLNWLYVRDVLQMPSITGETKGVTAR